MSGYEEMKSKGSFGEATGHQRTKAEEDSADRFAQAVAWAERQLPDEHPQLAASTALTLRLAGHWPSPDAVRRRLKEQGRTA